MNALELLLKYENYSQRCHLFLVYWAYGLLLSRGEKKELPKDFPNLLVTLELLYVVWGLALLFSFFDLFSHFSKCSIDG
jgi:hypothetical protein